MNQKLSIIISAVDKITKPIRHIIKGADHLTQSLQNNQTEINRLSQLDRSINQFNALKSKLNDTNQSLVQAKEKTNALLTTIKKTPKLTQKLKSEFDKARKSLERLEQKQQRERKSLNQLRQSLKVAGYSTHELGQAQNGIRQQINQTTQSIEHQEQKLNRLKATQAKIANAKKLMDKQLARGANFSLIAQNANQLSQSIGQGTLDFLDPLRQVEKAKGELATVGVQDLDIIIAKGQELQAKLSGITAAQFTTAAYDIKSGIASLSDEGVASLTASAVTVAKATKALPEQMTSLFATSYGIFKRQFSELNDGEFGDLFGAALSASVQQFKTDGQKMQQAIETAGAFASNLGMGLQEQLTVLGLLQAQMKAGDAGTALKSFAENAAKAQSAFDQLAMKSENPIQVNILDKKGQLRAMPDILQDLQKRYGNTLDAFESAEIKQAFGTTEAAKLINALWGQQNAVKANTQSLMDASKQGAKFTQTMAELNNNNLDAKLNLLSQKVDLAKQKIGVRLLPVLDRLLPKIENIIVKTTEWAAEHPQLITWLGALILGMGALATILAPVFSVLAALVGSFALFKFSLVKASGSVGIFSKIISKLGFVLAWLSKTAVPILLTGLRAIGAFLLANPITAAIMAIASVALLIYQYWEPIKSFFSELWQGLVNAINPAISAVKTFLSTFSPIGTLITGVKNLMGWLGESEDKHTEITQKVKQVIEPTKPILGSAAIATSLAINPVAAQINELPKPSDSMQTLAASSSKAANNKNITINHRPNYQITIQANASMNERQLVNLIHQELEQRDEEQALKMRSQLFDVS